MLLIGVLNVTNLAIIQENAKVKPESRRFEKKGYNNFPSLCCLSLC